MRQIIVTFNSVDLKGNLLYPGEWRETYVQVVTGVWMLIARVPYERQSNPWPTAF